MNSGMHQGVKEYVASTTPSLLSRLMVIRWLLIFPLLLCAFDLVGQDESEDKDEKITPTELISSYYKNWPSPFTKGNGYVGFAFSLEDKELNNVTRLLDRVEQGELFEYDLDFKGGYFIGDYSMIGLTVNYSRGSFEGTLIDQNSDSLYRQSIDVTAVITPSLKIFYPLVPTERLSLFTQLGVGFGGANRLRTDTRNQDEINRVFIDETILNAGLGAGIVFFAIENFAFEVELNNLVGYEFRKVNSTINAVPQSSTISNEVNFRIDLLSLRLGLAYYFRGKNSKR